MTLENNRVHLLCYFQLWASFHSHMWIQTGITVRKLPNWGKICFYLCDLDRWLLTFTFCMDITFGNGDNSCKFHDDRMTGTLRKMCERQTDGWMDRNVLRASWSQLKNKGFHWECIWKCYMQCRMAATMSTPYASLESVDTCWDNIYVYIYISLRCMQFMCIHVQICMHNHQ